MTNQKKIILVIEDEKTLLAAIKFSLEKHNFQVVTARNIEQAKNHVLDINKIDAIWLDHYLLGRENGLDFLIWCKQEVNNYKNIPIFVVSNTASPDKVQAYLAFGVDNYYVKAEKRLKDIIQDIKSFLEAKEK